MEYNQAARYHTYLRPRVLNQPAIAAIPHPPSQTAFADSTQSANQPGAGGAFPRSSSNLSTAVASPRNNRRPCLADPPNISNLPGVAAFPQNPGRPEPASFPHLLAISAFVAFPQLASQPASPKLASLSTSPDSPPLASQLETRRSKAPPHPHPLGERAFNHIPTLWAGGLVVVRAHWTLKWGIGNAESAER